MTVVPSQQPRSQTRPIKPDRQAPAALGLPAAALIYYQDVTAELEKSLAVTTWACLCVRSGGGSAEKMCRPSSQRDAQLAFC